MKILTSISKMNVTDDSGFIECDYLKVIIGKNEYTLTESIDKNLVISKSSNITSTLTVHPKYSNEIEVK